ncbi:MAG TPA: hypothetical protein VGP24_08805 [Glaciihabitans sp.]|nr:hypothetical protein [Glaciihabitans sp.]
MIVWQRWGILVFIFFGLSVGLGFALKSVIAPTLDSNEPTMNLFMGTGFILGAVALWCFNAFALTRLDKPRLSVVHERVSEPVTNAQGHQEFFRAVPVLHPVTGEQMVIRPRSTFFFIPMVFWPYAIAALGIVVLIVGFVGM